MKFRISSIFSDLIVNNAYFLSRQFNYLLMNFHAKLHYPQLQFSFLKTDRKCKLAEIWYSSPNPFRITGNIDLRFWTIKFFPLFLASFAKDIKIMIILKMLLKLFYSHYTWIKMRILFIDKKSWFSSPWQSIVLSTLIILSVIFLGEHVHCERF